MAAFLRCELNVAAIRAQETTGTGNFSKWNKMRNAESVEAHPPPMGKGAAPQSLYCMEGKGCATRPMILRCMLLLEYRTHAR